MQVGITSAVASSVPKPVLVYGLAGEANLVGF